MIFPSLNFCLNVRYRFCGIGIRTLLRNSFEWPGSKTTGSSIISFVGNPFFCLVNSPEKRYAISLLSSNVYLNTNTEILSTEKALNPVFTILNSSQTGRIYRIFSQLSGQACSFSSLTGIYYATDVSHKKSTSVNCLLWLKAKYNAKTAIRVFIAVIE